MLTHNTHYASNEDRGRIVGYACNDIVTGKFLSPSGGWTKYKYKADIFISRQLVKEVYSESRYFALPVFVSDNNEMVRRGWGIK